VQERRLQSLRRRARRGLSCSPQRRSRHPRHAPAGEQPKSAVRRQFHAVPAPPAGETGREGRRRRAATACNVAGPVTGTAAELPEPDSGVSACGRSYGRQQVGLRRARMLTQSLPRKRGGAVALGGPWPPVPTVPSVRCTLTFGVFVLVARAAKAARQHGSRRPAFKHAPRMSSRYAGGTAPCVL
jgi:hypothetical protein